jgi:Rrf2 family protein
MRWVMNGARCLPLRLPTHDPLALSCHNPHQCGGDLMTFSAKTQYALVSLIELAAVYSQGGVLQVGEIAQRQNIPDRYLEQMLTALRRVQILRSQRGPKGGYQLARPPSQVKLAEVVSSLEGNPAPSGTTRQSPEFQVLANLEDQLERARQQVLQQTTLQDLLEQRNSLAQSQIMYFI